MASMVTRTVNTYHVRLFEAVKTETGYDMVVAGVGQYQGTSCTKKDMRDALKRAGVHVKPGAYMDAEIIGKTVYSVPWEKFLEIAEAQEVAVKPAEAEVEE